MGREKIILGMLRRLTPAELFILAGRHNCYISERTEINRIRFCFSSYARFEHMFCALVIQIGPCIMEIAGQGANHLSALKGLEREVRLEIQGIQSVTDKLADLVWEEFTSPLV